MVNCHKDFLRFNEALNLSDVWFNRLKSAKRGIEKQLRRYFDPLPGFNIKWLRSQGSKKLGTLIRRQTGTVDFDYGVYFYPKPPGTADELIDLVYEALYGLRTFTEPEIKSKCIQVTYADRARIHFDVPIYYLTNDSGDLGPRLATQRGWMKSSPYQFERWYSEHYNPQMTRIVRYLKAWSAHQSTLAQMPKGVALTVLAATHHRAHERDDVSLVETLASIQRALTAKWHCVMPIEPHDNLLRKCAGENKAIFLSQLNAFITDGNRALRTSRRPTARSLWRTHLGSYFPK